MYRDSLIPCRAPQEGLLETAESPIGIPADQIDVQRFEIGRRQYFTADRSRVEIRDMSSKSLDYSIRKFFAHARCPLPVAANCNLRRGVALNVPRHVQNLDPQNALPRRNPSRIDV